MSKLFNPERKDRLDRPERAAWQKPDDVVATLGLEPGMAVADIGAGTGYFAFRIAPLVGASGMVYAVDLQQEMLDTVQERAEEQGVKSITFVKSGPVATTLPDDTVDLVFLSSITHEYDDIDEGIAECARITKPGGRIAVVDWAYRETEVGPPLDHRLDPEKLIAAIKKAGFRSSDPIPLLDHHYFYIFSRAGA